MFSYRGIRVLTALGLAGALLPSAIAAQASLRDRSAPEVGAVRAVGEIRIDGRFDEPAWAAAVPVRTFTQSYPEPGAQPTEATEARFLYDDQNLYVAVRLHDSRPDSIAAPITRRDPTNLYSDWLHLLVDSRMDRRSAFRFSVNPRGVQRDVYMYDDNQEDGSWDAIWEVATQIDSLGWTAEYRIPFSQLRFGGGEGDARTWGLQLMRDIARRGERATWSPWTRDDAGFVSRFGTMTGLTGVRQPRAVEFMPYLSSQLERARREIDNPFSSSSSAGAAIGADLRVGIPLGLTLTATVNPDFGQVEADPAEVNLTVFETFLTERRPFFVEGADIFRFGETRAYARHGFQEYFYSRRIGRAPQRQLVGPDFVYVDAPNQARILGAAKVSGRTPGGWSIGLMNAVTDRETARYVDPDGNSLLTAVEPLSNYLTGRVRRDLRDGATVVGALATGAVRKLDEPELVNRLHDRAGLVGVDFMHAWGDRAWSLSGMFAASGVSGSTAAVTATQQRAARYYQRPDAGYLQLDPHATTLGGHMSEFALAHAGEWLASLQLKQISPGFEINDLGFQGRVDSRSIAGFVGRQINRPSRIFRQYGYRAWGFRAWNFGGDLLLDGVSGGAGGTFHNFWEPSVQVGYRPSYLNDRLTRGGPIGVTPEQYSFNLTVNSDNRERVTFGADLSFRGDTEGERDRGVSGRVDIRPSSAVRLRFSPRLDRNEYTAQYVRAFADPAASATFGSRYLFANLDQTTISMESRVEWTFTPTVSLQLYAQPFVSAGRYSAFKEFAAPGTYLFDVYGEDRGTICRIGGNYFVSPNTAVACPAEAPTDDTFSMRFADPDFNLRSLRGNAVFRWEYSPGSTLFFVWQQHRSGSALNGDFDLQRDVGAIFREPAENVFLVKATYWLGR